MTKATTFRPTLSATSGMEPSAMRDVDAKPVKLHAEDGAFSRGILWKKAGSTPRVAVHAMHPRTDQSYNYCIPALVEAGYAVLGRAGRWPNNDVATEHEPLLLDLAAGIRYLQGEGYEQVILLGNSGGGTLATFYQSQARKPPSERLADTAAGDPLPLGEFDLPPADGLILIGAHVGEGGVMAKCLDGSVVDETDPLATDPELDIYDPRNGFVLPPASSHYDPDFVARYRAAQSARAARLDAIASSLIERQRDAGFLASTSDSARALRAQREATIGWHMIIYRTMADPAMVDLSIDPDDRIVRSYLTTQPHLDNYNEVGFARYLTPRAWLSTWSPNTSRAVTAENLRDIRDPFLLVHYAGDCGMRMEETSRIMNAAASEDKELFVIEKADHYGFEIKPDGTLGSRTSRGTGRVTSWMQERFPLATVALAP
jgi:pimeloyl-ACP methyl ester carboxylesterase